MFGGVRINFGSVRIITQLSHQIGIMHGKYQYLIYCHMTVRSYVLYGGFRNFSF